MWDGDEILRTWYGNQIEIGEKKLVFKEAEKIELIPEDSSRITALENELKIIKNFLTGSIKFT